ncbi:hypothetical protein HBI24_167490 [Parastagonospora nodorum]|nr:hypothetical protein HBH53_115300 [Parastagonospora nodorum]KAH4292901.1 hypothetical protein HBI01_175610 [Parastagonospora nodorum]KAH4293580.1 hypothetical protein HBI02_184700 [Parastagonospora nodorum]KAH4324369.1 hypothetical protein HBI00_173170 [Parastagonospora nodorum]KAH4364851.1 hypothetical protein HBH94_157810 [Parastagonospora nodorum]
MGNSQCESDEEASRQNILKQERNAAIDYAEVMKDEHLQKQQVHRRAVDARREEGAWTKWDIRTHSTIDRVGYTWTVSVTSSP